SPGGCREEFSVPPKRSGIQSFALAREGPVRMVVQDVPQSNRVFRAGDSDDISTGSEGHPTALRREKSIRYLEMLDLAGGSNIDHRQLLPSCGGQRPSVGGEAEGIVDVEIRGQTSELPSRLGLPEDDFPDAAEGRDGFSIRRDGQRVGEAFVSGVVEDLLARRCVEEPDEPVPGSQGQHLPIGGEGITRAISSDRWNPEFFLSGRDVPENSYLRSIGRQRSSI